MVEGQCRATVVLQAVEQLRWTSVSKLGASPSGADGVEERNRHHAPDDRRGLQHLRDRARKEVDPRGEQPFHGGRNLAVSHPGSEATRHCDVRGRRGPRSATEELFDEERVPGRSLDDPRHEPRGRRIAEDVLDELADAGLVQRSSRTIRDAGIELLEAASPSGLEVEVEDEAASRRLARARVSARCSGVCPVRIFQCEDDRSVGGYARKPRVNPAWSPRRNASGSRAAISSVRRREPQKPAK